jgi:hypothetical protein
VTIRVCLLCYVRAVGKLNREPDTWRGTLGSWRLHSLRRTGNCFWPQYQKAELMERVDISFFVESDFVEDALVSCSSCLCTFLWMNVEGRAVYTSGLLVRGTWRHASAWILVIETTELDVHTSVCVAAANHNVLYLYFTKRTHVEDVVIVRTFRHRNDVLNFDDI